MRAAADRWKTLRVVVLVLGGAALATAGPWFAIDGYAFLRDSLRAPGLVIALASQRVRGSTLYRPVVRFRPAGAETTVEFTAKPGLWPSPYAVGDRVVVAYRRGEPKTARVVSFSMLWLLPLLTLSFGCACLCAGYHTHRSEA